MSRIPSGSDGQFSAIENLAMTRLAGPAVPVEIRGVISEENHRYE
jgi:hypothetical protein